MRRKRDTEPPWVAAGMSRASWYRHGKPAEKPERSITQRDIVALSDELQGGAIRLRTYQRHLRVQREAPELLAPIKAGLLSLGQAERLIRRGTVTRFFAWLDRQKTPQREGNPGDDR